MRDATNLLAIVLAFLLGAGLVMRHTHLERKRERRASHDEVIFVGKEACHTAAESSDGTMWCVGTLGMKQVRVLK